MPINFAVAKCTLPVAHDVCFKLTGLKTFYVTSQPVYIWPGASPSIRCCRCATPRNISRR
jgi:hypothetical protein